MPKWRLFFAFGLLMLDQWSKQVALGTLTMAVPVSVLPGMQLTLAANRGIAFSQFDDAIGWQYLLLLAVIITISTVVFVLMLKAVEKMQVLAYALLSGGALGNLLDRLMHGYIIDFIDLYYKNWHWPVFNLADTYIFIGVLLLIKIHFWNGEGSHEDKASKS